MYKTAPPLEFLTLLGVILILGLSSLAIEIEASPKEEVYYNYYYIYPNTRPEIQLEIDRNSPLMYEGEQVIALTNWTVRWRFDVSKTETGCQLVDIETQIIITYTLPAIPRRHKAPEMVTTAFDIYFKDLMAHENEHADLGYRAIYDIEDYLMANKQGKGTCYELNKLARQETKAILSKYERKNIELDQRKEEHDRKFGSGLDYFIR